jgi:hypothetical protein
MSSDDDTILSAYMDGQLDAGRQQRVESALVASPRLAENLRALSAVRDLVAGLPRDAGVDVSPEVMRRIRSLGRSPSRLDQSRPGAVWARRIAVGAGSVAVAAAILLMVMVLFSVPGNHGAATASRKAIDNVIADSGPGANTRLTDERGVSVAVDSGSSALRTAAVKSESLDTVSPADEQRTALAVALDTGSSYDDQQLARRMLDSPAERRLFVVKNGADGKIQQQVASVVERTSRFGFFKITVSQGIVIDPRHPDEATVFALLVSPKELGRLHDQLKNVIPDAVEESHADPGIVTQLADIGRVKQFAPVPTAEPATPGEVLAIRTRVGASDNGSPPAATTRRHPTPEQYNSAPDPHGPRRSIAVPDSEQGIEVATVDNGSRTAPNGPGSARAQTHSSDPLADAKLVVPKPESAAIASESAKPDEMVLVFVWICKSRPS